MIRAIRPSAMAQDDASLLSGWNVAPNVGYTVVLTPGPTACGVLLFDADMQALIASGAGLVGTDQPVIMLQQTGQTIGMVDADLGWHLLLTTTGTEAKQTIRIGPAVDLPDETHPVYSDDNMALARATAAINAGASYVDDVTVTCPLGLSAGIGDTASVPVDGVAVVGQVESVTWTATPDGATTQAVIRRHSAIAPEATIAPPTPPSVIDDAAETDAATEASGNVLTNDDEGLTVVAVNGLSANVGQIVAGSNGGEFVINANGAWTFDPSGDFAALSGSATATTSVSYHVSNGDAEASATLTVTVSSAEAQPWTPAEIATKLWLDAADASTVITSGSKVTQWSDKSGNGSHFTQGTDSLRPSLGTNKIVFGGGHWLQNSTAQLPLTEFVFGIVFKEDVAVANAGVLSLKGTNYDWNSTNGLIFGPSNKTNARCICTGSTSANFELKDTTAPTGPCPLAVYGVEKSATVGSFYRDGNLLATDSSFTAFASVSVGGVVIGARQNPALSSPYLNGEVMEIVYAPKTDRQKIEGYLAHKWGLAANLPSDHPYKSAAPTI